MSSVCVKFPDFNHQHCYFWNCQRKLELLIPCRYPLIHFWGCLLPRLVCRDPYNLKLEKEKKRGKEVCTPSFSCQVTRII
ncbi:hypothetical protein KSS87_012719 [Heliosperma pusillum]|nr:hypothetical protein KSS87_012719 [Heliosperma pusillum]